MNYLMKQKPLPPNLHYKLRAINWTGIILSVLLPTAYAVINGLQTIRIMRNEELKYAYILFIPYVLIGIFQLVAFILLVNGVFKIRRLIVQNDSREFNNKMLFVHMLSFAVYLCVGVAIAVRTLIFSKNDLNAVVLLATISLILFVFMMAALLAILYRLGATPKILVDTSLTTDDDEETDVPLILSEDLLSA